ncbi:MAG TPA: hypothetical protein DEP12_00405 [Planctomycetaceae bacterium]|nr:hypothetical protein [Planctomycetaceae bacterium]
MVQVGPQNIAFGSPRLLTSLVRANTRRPVGGAIFQKKITNGTLKSFWLQPVAIAANDVDRTNHNLSHYGVYFDGESTSDSDLSNSSIVV